MIKGMEGIHFLPSVKAVRDVGKGGCWHCAEQGKEPLALRRSILPLMS